MLDSVTVALSGLVLAAHAAMLSVQNPTGCLATHVLLPGGAGAVVLVLVGLGILAYATRSTERARLAGILKKLLAEDLGSQGRKPIPGDAPGI